MQRSETTERKKKTNIQIEPQTIGLTEIETFTNRQIYIDNRTSKRRTDRKRERRSVI